MTCRDSILFQPAQFLIELFAGPDAGKLDANIDVRLQSTEQNQVTGEILNSYRLAHIEHKDFPSLPHRSSLQNEARCFRYRHEKPANFRMRNRHRPTRRNLPL